MEFQNLPYNAHNIFVESMHFLSYSSLSFSVFSLPILKQAIVRLPYVISREIKVNAEFSGQLISDIKKLPFTRGNNLSKNHGNSFTAGKSRELHTARKREREGLGVLLWDCVSLGFYVLYPSGFAIR